MTNFEKNLFAVSSVCNGDHCFGEEFSKIYSFTTENISGYIDYFDLKDKSLLTVGSSGDQILNAFYNGARDITLFDLNEYAKYFVYLKISAIMSLSYEEFKLFFFTRSVNPFKENKSMFSKEIFMKLQENLRILDYESYLFFDELFSLYDNKTIRENLFDDDESRNKVILNYNNYLKDENSYNKLKGIINKLYFKYINGDIFLDKIDGKYNNIFLSNLCSITSLKNLRDLLVKIDKNNLKEDGSILLGYLWDISFDCNEFDKNWKDIYKMPIVRNYLKDYISETHSIKSSRDIMFDTNKKEDLVLIYRKK